MKIRIDYESFQSDFEIEEYVVKELTSCEEGSVERATQTAENVADAMGKLIEVLARNGQLSAAQIEYIASGCDDGSASYPEESA